MPDDNTRDPRRHGAPHDWNAAFAALPLERPDTDAWDAIAARLPARKAAHWPMRLALAAALALAVVVPLRMLAPTDDAPIDTVAATTPAPVAPASAIDPLEQLYAESAQLEALLTIARDDRVASGAAVEVAADLATELARIDAQLRQPGLARDRQLALWRARVDMLRSTVGFETTRRWLAANGERYDGALVQVD